MGYSGSNPVSHVEVWRPAGVDVVLLTAPSVTVGRHPGNDIVLDDGQVSALHAVLQAYGASWAMRDLGSRNGTTVAGERLLSERALRDGDTIRVGQTRLVYRATTNGPLKPTMGVDPAPTLTPRERDVLIALCRPLFTGDLVRQPATAREISHVLVVTEAAVKQHLMHLYEKFGLESGRKDRRVDLARDALRRGAVTPGDLGTTS